MSTSLNAEVQKTAKIGVFPPPEGDRINQSRRILKRKRALWVSYGTPDLALIGTGAPKSQNFGFWPPEADTMNTFT